MSTTKGIQKGGRNDLVTSFDSDGVVIREAEWAGQNVSFQRFPKGFDIGPLLRGLPHDECQCPHHGYVLRGAMIVRSGGREVRVAAGEAYHLGPGHSIRFDEDTELVEWSPAEELARTMEVISRNLAPPAGASP